MRIYKIRSDVEKYTSAIIGIQGHSVLPVFDGRSVAGVWPLISGYQSCEKDESIGDFAYLSPGCLVANGRSRRVLESVTAGYVEWLPLELGNGDWFVMNITNVLDCLDREKSDIKVFEESGRVRRIVEFVFLGDKVKGPLFKIPEAPESYVFATQTFVDRVTACNLVGIKMTRIA